MFTIDTISVGSAADDGLGDTLRDAFIKVNSNFDSINTTLNSGTIEFPGSITLGDSASDITSVSGKLGIGTNSPTATLDVNADTVRVRTTKTPASATATGNAGDICWDADYVYVCVATNTWKRSALSTW